MKKGVVMTSTHYLLRHNRKEDMRTKKKKKRKIDTLHIIFVAAPVFA
jgi:hypothetical protein